jgi:hypothetical protein
MNTPGIRLPGLALALLALTTSVGCRSLDRFNAEKPAAYCGDVVGATAFQTGLIPSGSPPTLQVRLQLDTSSLSDRPGTLTSHDAGHGICNDSPLFDEAPLRAIPELLHDALSQLEFGQGHEHDLFAWVDSTCKGTMLAVVSLLSNGAIEVRLFKPAPDLPPPPMTDQADLSGFALFYLQRNKTGCGF